MAEILIIDCDQEYAKQLQDGLGKLGHKAKAVDCFHDGLGMLAKGSFSVVILNEDATTDNVVEMINHIRACDCFPEVIVLSWLGDPDIAEDAIRAGAWNYFSKPISLLRLKVVLERILSSHSRHDTARTISLKREGIIGNARPMQVCLDEVARAATTESSALITGETGTGKELFARAVHENSSRAAGGFVVVDCAALPQTLAESVLFGHEKGAFTSADSRRDGLVREAHLGTLFLDEVGELPLLTQKVFLRVLEQRCFRPVGSTREIVSDFRLVSATNRDLEKMIEKGTFRRDLYYRLRAMTINLPLLRSIPEDINDIICFYIGKITMRMGVPRKAFSPDFLDTLMNYAWPGNIRELINAMERALSMAGDEPILFPRHLPTSIRAMAARSSMSQASKQPEPPAEKPPRTCQTDCPVPGPLPQLKQFRAEHLAKLERMYLKELLSSSGNDINQCLRVSGLSRARFYALLQEHGLRRSKQK